MLHGLRVPRIALSASLLAVGTLSAASVSAQAVTEFAPLEEPVATKPRPGAIAAPPRNSAGSASLPPVTSVSATPTPAPQPSRTAPAVVPVDVAMLPAAPRATPLAASERDDSAATEDDDSSETTHHVAVTFSVARVFASLYELTAEVRLAKRLSLAGLAGIGEFEATIPQIDQRFHLSGREFGGQARLYLIGGFDHGLFVGAELLRIWAKTPANDIAKGSGTLTGSGAFLGYKVSADFGLTFDAKLGVQHIAVAGEGTASGQVVYMGQSQTFNQSESLNEKRTIPLVNVNFGWAI